MLRLVHVLFFVCCCVAVPTVDVGMCVCGAACSARCGVLQRRHGFDAFLKRLGKRQPQELIRHWIRTATRHSLSDDSLCGHLRVERESRSRLNSKLQKMPKSRTSTSEGLAGPSRGKKPESASQRTPLIDNSGGCMEDVM